MDQVVAQALTLYDDIAAAARGETADAPRPTATRKATLPVHARDKDAARASGDGGSIPAPDV